MRGGAAESPILPAALLDSSLGQVVLSRPESSGHRSVNRSGVLEEGGRALPLHQGLPQASTGASTCGDHSLSRARACVSTSLGHARMVLS